MIISRLALGITLVLGLVSGGLLTLALLTGRNYPDGEFLAFEKIINRRSDIVVYDPVTRMTLNLTRTPEHNETYPVWSSGGRLAYITDETGQMGLYMRDLVRSSRPVRLLLTFAPMAYPVWWGDERLAYVSGEDGNMEIYLYDFAEGDTVNVTRYPVDDFEPAWMPDGRVSFVSGRSGNLDVYALDLDDRRNVVNLTEHADPDHQMRWSNDGRGAFVRAHPVSRQSAANPTPTTDAEIYILDGDEQINVSQWLGFDSDPQWSHDGRLAFVSMRSGNMDIWVYENGELVNVTQHPAQDTEPRWSADGRLAFYSLRNPSGLYVMDTTARWVATGAGQVVWWRWPAGRD